MIDDGVVVRERDYSGTRFTSRDEKIIRRTGAYFITHDYNNDDDLLGSRH